MPPLTALSVLAQSLRRSYASRTLWPTSLNDASLGRTRLWEFLTSVERLSTLPIPVEKLHPEGSTRTDDPLTSASVETSHLVYDLPSEWYNKRISPALKRERIVTLFTDWSKRHAITSVLLSKLTLGPLSQQELRKYTSNQIARFICALGIQRKTQSHIADSPKIRPLLEALTAEALGRKRLMTYDGMGLAQAAFGFSMLKPGEASLFQIIAEEALKPHRMRNTQGKSIVNLLEAFQYGGYWNQTQIQALSEPVVQQLDTLPAFALPKLLSAWGHFGYSNATHIRAALVETLKEIRLNALLASHIELILTACAKLKFRDTKIVTQFVRELIYSQKWKFMTQGALARIVWSLGQLHHQQPQHWHQILTAALDPDRLSVLDSNLLVDIYVGWSKVMFRDSSLLDQLGREATKEARVMEFSTRQLFEIFKAQRALGQLERSYATPILDRLRDTEKLMKCNVETKIKIFLYPSIKKTLGMKNVASLAKEIFQPMCLDRWHSSVLLTLAQALAALGPQFDICFAELVKELVKHDRVTQLSAEDMAQVLWVWRKLEYRDGPLDTFAEECTTQSRLESYSETALLKLMWHLNQLGGEDVQSHLRILATEALRRPMTIYTGKGLTMLLSCISQHQCLESTDAQPLIQAVLEPSVVSELTPAQMTSLKEALMELGCEEEAEKLESVQELSSEA